MIKPGQNWTEALQEDLTGSFLRILSQNPSNEEERWISEEELRKWIWATILSNSELAWGLIQGTITNQADLAAALDACMTHDEFEALHATQAEAIAGSATKPWMSPLRVKEAIDALTTWGNIQGNLADQSDLNAALGAKVSVDSLANPTEAANGTEETKWMSPARTTDAIAAFQKATTGTEISFVVSRVYNTHGAPATANITESLTNARAGNVQKIYHNHSAAPTFPAGWVRLGAADYVVDVLNIIYAEWISGTRVEFWIVQES